MIIHQISDNLFTPHYNTLHHATLHYTGELGKSEELAGRAKDGRVIDPSAKVDGVKLEYRDEFGRKLTQKEAFRQICYRFHGYGPGKKAKEKRLKVTNVLFLSLYFLRSFLPSF